MTLRIEKLFFAISGWLDHHGLTWLGARIFQLGCWLTPREIVDRAKREVARLRQLEETRRQEAERVAGCAAMNNAVEYLANLQETANGRRVDLSNLGS
jgi:hypothetical protein